MFIIKNLSFGETIRFLRKEKKKTIEEMAAVIGVTQSYLSRIERNMQKPSIEIIEKITYYLDVHKAFLFFNEGNQDHLFTLKSISIDELKELNIVRDNGERLTEKELQWLIDSLKLLKD
ncbi:helix-turn-helix transcriptional regulator [Bacillus mexicanus]|uniref:helix-turn-helix domain-containing protein n=1 Tax=Bacillus mexicanus TaxID=2834415 RepID=UPI003D197665